MISAAKATTIQAPPEKVWEYLEDADKELQWRKPEVVELTKLDAGAIRVGSR